MDCFKNIKKSRVGLEKRFSFCSCVGTYIYNHRIYTTFLAYLSYQIIVMYGRLCNIAIESINEYGYE